MAKKKEQPPSVAKAKNIAESTVFDESIYTHVREILEAARKRAYAALSREMVMAYWNVGKKISETTNGRAEYGAFVVKNISERLTRDYGSGFSKRNVFYMRQIYEAFPNSADAFAQLS
ncbi:MAG: DUF1016 N-terminal domain-containing protein [Clostridiales bacterium]|jgi:hypothetical protein|nr:DUF1016 N-terminal domain-containing protein [Clostridiales bacterium]